MTLDKRLSLAASYVRPGSRLADIGTDHARLPTALVASGRCPRAVASDLRPGPVKAARRTVAAARLETVIDIRLGDGLNTLAPDEADDIVIAGMGGETIAAILEAAPWIRDSRYRLILQPMTRAEHLHRYLLQNGFSILREEAVQDEGRLYLALLAAFSDAPPAEEGDLRFLTGALSPTGAGKRYIEKQRRLLLRRAAGLRSRPLSSAAEKAEADRLEEAAAALRAYGEEST